MLNLSWRTLLRDARSGDLWMIAAAVVLAVASITTVAFFSDRMALGLQRDAAQLLGGDAVVVSDNPLPAAFLAQASSQSLRQSQTMTFPTMARSAVVGSEQTRLAALKAVGDGYPLRGSLNLRSSLDTPVQVAKGPPATGTVWVDRALLTALGLQLGDSLALGDAQFRVTHLIESEPDRGSGFSNFAPRVMLGLQDMDATGLVQPASRVSYRLAVATADGQPGAKAQIEQFKQWVQLRLSDTTQTQYKGIRLESLESGRPEMTQTLKRASGFLNLVTLLAALMGAVALAVAARNFAARHLNGCAMLRVFGLSQTGIVRLYGLELLYLAVLSSAVGVVIGYGVQVALVATLGDLLTVALPAPSWRPVGLGLGVGIILVLSFGLAPVLQLSKVSPLRVLRRDVGAPQASMLLGIAAGLSGFSGILLLVADNEAMAGMVLGGFMAASVLFVGMAFVGVRASRRFFQGPQVPTWLRITSRQMSARPMAAALQVASLSLGLLALLLLVLLRTDLVQGWRQSSSSKAPDRFVINVMTDQAPAFRQALQAGQAQLMDWYPMIRGRLIQVNGQPVGPDQFSDDRAKRLVDREFNLSTSETLPTHNQVVAGRWQNGESGAISIEEGLAQTLQLRLGDTLTFDMGGLTTQARITSFRKVDWSSMRANFFALYPVQTLSEVPQTWMGTFRVPAQTQLDNSLVRQFPNVTIVDTRQTIDQVQKVVNQVILAVELLFGFSLMAGILVVTTSLSSSRVDRLHELSVMRAMGASRALLVKMQRTELALMGTAAGLMACGVANLLAFALSRYALDLAWTFSWWSLFYGLLGGLLLAQAAGVLALRGIANRPVIQSLRQTF